MPVITIRGLYGCWADEIGERIAQKLNIDYVDRMIIAEVAERLRQPSKNVEEKEMPPSTLWGRIAEAIAKAPYMGDSIYTGLYAPLWEIPLDDKNYLAALESVVKELAATRSIVILGRGSQFILKDVPGAFHALIVAPVNVRVKRVRERQNLKEKDALNEIARSDDAAREFIKRYFQANLTDPVNYDMVLNVNHLDSEAAAALIVDALPRLNAGTAGGKP